MQTDRTISLNPKIKTTIYLLLVAIFVAVFFKTAWVCDDAYINFRSLEQLHTGNGPIWNPHERVQAYTSPLWYWLLAALSFVINDYFICMLLVSFVLFILIAYHVGRLTDSRLALSVIMLLALGSRTFYDFSTSGLESILCSFLTVYILISFFNYSKSERGSEKAEHYYKNALIAFAFVPLCRHDLTTLLALPILFMVYDNDSRTWKQRVIDLLLVAVPLFIWTVFSTVYYGMPLPNTAYAKLHTGVAKSVLFSQGITYVIHSAMHEPVIALSFIISLIFSFISHKKSVKVVSAGILLNLVYVVSVGGDFMVGRFLLSSVIASILVILELNLIQRFCNKYSFPAMISLIILAMYVALYPFTSLNVPYDINVGDHEADGIADERLYYFEISSLMAWWENRNNFISPKYRYCFFPNSELSSVGVSLKTSDNKVIIDDVIGIQGFWTGTEKKVIDKFALTDPYLARHPVDPEAPFRIGHFERKIEDDYIYSVLNNVNLIKNPNDRHLYELLIKATQDKELFSISRFKAIWELLFL